MTALQSRLSTLTQGLLTLGSGDEAIHNAVVAVTWRGEHTAAAAGRARADSPAPMRPDTQFHIASVAKPMTAALIFRACEAGKFGPAGIDTRLIDTGVLPHDVCARLLVVADRLVGGELTLRQLLTHTSGMRDTQVDDGDGTAEQHGRMAPNGIAGSRARDMPQHMAALAEGRTPDPTLLTRKSWRPWDAAQPQDRWAGLINYYLNTPGMTRALTPPGTAFHYSDTAFMLLALLAEHALGASYHRLLRREIFDPIGMNASYLDSFSDLDPSPWRHVVSDCWAGSTPIVSSGISLSNDWGGGGIISTATDLNKFLAGLLDGRLFTRPATLDAMLTWQEPMGRPDRYTRVGHGIFTFTTPAGRIAIGHSGAWGAKMLAVPDQQFILSGTVNRRGASGTWALEMIDQLLD